MNPSIQYQKKLEAWHLRRLPEYTSLSFSMGMTLVLGLIILIFFRGTSASSLYIGAFFLVSGVLAGLVRWKMRLDVRRQSTLNPKTRWFGWLLLIMGLMANPFLLISAFYLLFKKKGIEIQLAIYAFIVAYATMLVSMLNLFKAYVANQFMMGIGILLASCLMMIVVMILIQFFVQGKKIHQVMLIPAVMLLPMTLSGNLFATLLGIVLISKYRHQDRDATIEWVDVLNRLFRNNMSAIGMLFVVFLITLSVMSRFTFDASMAIDNDYSALFTKPSLAYPFGSDNYGRDVFTRIVMGAQISLIVGTIATMVPVVIGGLLGSLAGYFGGRFDNIIMRVLDILYAVPGILLAIAIVAAFGANTFNLIMALSLGGIPSYSRIVRATVMSVSNNEFVEAARASGAKNARIILRHIIPNSLAPVIVNATLGIGSAVLSTSALSYLGLGVEPHIPEWGNILKVGSAYLETNPYLAIFPGLAIILIVLAFNFFGDGLRDALDPKLK